MCHKCLILNGRFYNKIKCKIILFNFVIKSIYCPRTTIKTLPFNIKHLWIVLDNAQITTIAIDEQYRGYGLGQLLLKYVIDYVQEECEALSLEVRVDNYVAQHVYQNLGFQYGY